MVLPFLTGIPVINIPACAVLFKAVSLLDLAFELVALASDAVKVVVSELAPLAARLREMFRFTPRRAFANSGRLTIESPFPHHPTYLHAKRHPQADWLSREFVACHNQVGNHFGDSAARYANPLNFERTN